MFVEIFVFVLCVLCIIVVLFELYKWSINRTKLKNFGSVRSYPIVGAAYKVFGANNEDVMQKLSEAFDEAEKTPAYAWAGAMLIIGIDQPEDMQVILNAEQFLDKPYFYKHMHIKTGLLEAPKSIWKMHRRALNPTLSNKMVTSFIPIFNEKLKIMADRLDRMVGKNIDVYRVIFKASGDSILNTSFGLKCDFQTKRGDEIHDELTSFMSSVMQRMIRIWLRSDFFYNFTKNSKIEQKHHNNLRHFIYSTYEMKKLKLSESMERGEDKLEQARQNNCLNWIQKCLLLEGEGKFNEENWLDECHILFIGATDTTSIAMTAILLMLAIHQEHQEKIVAELREIFSDVDSPVTNEDLSKMTYMDMVIKESLRLFPVLPYIARECGEDFPYKGGIIPKGAVIFANILKLHRNPQYWGDDANVFHPERFLSENFSKMHPYTFMPFSGDPRNCIGMRYARCSLRIALAYLLRRFKFITDLKLNEVRTQTNLVLKISNENPVKVERRDW